MPHRSMLARTGHRSRLAALVVLAMVGALLSIALPVGAESGEVDEPALYSACVGPATASRGFVDMVGSFAEADADCLAHYRITLGKTATTFAPTASTTRVQMARFLRRAAGPAGITLPPARDQGFNDLGGLSAGDQDLINQLAWLEIMEGRTRSEFRPQDYVTREDMAVHLAAFLEHAIVGPGGVDIDDVDPDDEDVFEDIDHLSVRSYTPILKLYEMGITRGRTATRFSPDSLVSRAQMAAFIARTLAHTNARPAGITVQQVDDNGRVFEDDTVEFVASVRDKNNRPVEDAPVDFFWGDSEAEALDGSGECISARVQALEGTGSDECEIDGDDPETNMDGNLEDTVAVIAANDMVVWGWTGDYGDEFDEHTVEYAAVSVGVADAAENTRLTHNAGLSNTVRFGTRVTFTFQLIDEDGGRVRQDGAQINLETTVTEYEGHSTDDDVLDKESERRTYQTDGRGSLEFEFRQSDPQRGSDNDNITTVKLEIMEPTTFDVVDEDGRELHEIIVTWSDQDPDATLILLRQSSDYSTASTSGRNTVTVTVTDQYGTPDSGEEVTWATDDGVSELRSGDATRRVSSRGRANFVYDRESTAHGEETITVCLEDTTNCEEIVHYWGAEPADGPIGGTVAYVDKGDNVMVVEDGSNLWIVDYSTKPGASDQFSVDGTPVTGTAFENGLSVCDTIENTSTYSKDSLSEIDLTNADC